MELSKKDRMLSEYRNELLKQTNPYEYYIKKRSRIEGHDNNHGPLSCAIGVRELEINEENIAKLSDEKNKEIAKMLYNALAGYKIASVIINSPGSRSEEQTNRNSKGEAGGIPIFAITDRICELSDYYMIYKDTTTPDIEVISHNSDKLKEDLIYFDEDYYDHIEDKRYAPFFKPDYSADTLLSNNYYGSLILVKPVVLNLLYEKLCEEKIVNEYDLVLRLDEICGSAFHVSAVGAHNNRDIGIKPEEMNYPDFERNAASAVYREYVNENLEEENERVRQLAMSRRKYALAGNPVSLSIIIPSKNNSELLEKCLTSIEVKGGFNKYRYFGEITGESTPKTERQFSKTEIIIVDNGSDEKEQNKITSIIKNTKTKFVRTGIDCDIKYIFKPMEFNFSKMCNIGAKAAHGDFLMFMNDDVEVAMEDAIYRMCCYAAMKNTGIVGAKLYYPEGVLIQHTGITDLDCGPSHKLALHDDRLDYYFGINRFNRNVLACTAACIIIGKEKYFNIGGFDDKMKIGYNDVDLCVTALESDLNNIVLNDVFFYHHESVSRGMDTISDEKFTRLREERRLFYSKHEWLLSKRDPFYNINLIQDTLDYEVNCPPDYEILSSRCSVRKIDKSFDHDSRLRHLLSRKLRYSVDSIVFERAIMDNEEDYFRIEGWMLMDEADNAFCKRQLLLCDNSSSLVIDTMPKLRDDVCGVFPGGTNSRLCGFVCKIPESYLKINRKYRLGLMLEKIPGKIKYIVLGEYYERSENDTGNFRKV